MKRLVPVVYALVTACASPSASALPGAVRVRTLPSPGSGGAAEAPGGPSGAAPLDAENAGIGGARTAFLDDSPRGRRRALEALVAGAGFDVLAVPAPFADVIAVNGWALYGVGAPERTFDAGSRGDSGELLEAARWIRRMNARRPPTARVRLYGFAPGLSSIAVEAVERYLAHVDPELARRTERALWAIDERRLDDRVVGAGMAEIERSLDVRRGRYVAVSGRHSWEIARHHARTLAQGVAIARAPRDEAPALDAAARTTNLRWILDHEGADARMAVWGAAEAG